MYQKRNIELETLSLYTANYKARFYLRQISKLTKAPLKTIQNTLQRLEKEKILESKTEGKNKYFSLNQNNIKTKSLLLQSEIHKTDAFLDKYPEFKLFLKELKTETPIIVFGSFAKNTAKKSSDVDLLVLSKEEKLPTHLLPNKIHQLNLTQLSFQKALKNKEKIIEEIRDNHIILNNHSYFVNTFWREYGR
jgi:predicted nucleotidyltransferase